ncbi:MAG: type II toxin-antitoxin system HicA family toxin [Spirochaetaceae bacterium]|jgi:predicted RNA binding protein YcfA (HicA-like mRNA interferase family)|nr:type II toxin-antitoxin system HicA family toxin [Spirochaetaceae bacterium]
MKRLKLLQLPDDAGAVFVRHGKKHDVYRQPTTNRETTVPRHDEIKEFTAQSIIKTLAPPPPAVS